MTKLVKWANKQQLDMSAFKELLPVAATLRITYDGEGDDGGIEQCYLKSADNIKISQQPSWLMDYAEELVCEMLDAGWEIDDGSCGSILVNLLTGDVSHKHRVKSSYDY